MIFSVPIGEKIKIPEREITNSDILAFNSATPSEKAKILKTDT
jgi:hypothetical protein